MISGKVALGGLTLEFGNAEKRFRELKDKVEALTRAQEKLLGDEQGIVESLARMYLPELSPEAVSSGLTDLRERLDEALAAQEEHRRDLERSLTELPEDVARRELILAEAEREEERSAAALDAVRRSVEDELGSDSKHAENVLEHRAAMERRSILKARKARLQTTANVERHAYDEDRAFSYLLSRGYGEPEYRAGPVTRWLDGWLARRIDYTTLVRNYRVLRTGPHAIQAEIHRLTERAESLERAIDARQTDVAARLGLDAALKAEEAAQRAVVDAREALTEARGRHDRIAAEIRAVEAHRGRPYEDAVAMHRAFLEEQPIRDLLELARSTADPADDELVQKLEETRSRLEEIGRKLASHREELKRRASQSTDLADLARDAVARFTSRRSGFPEEFNLGRLVASVIDGRSDASEALTRIAESHVRRPLLEPARRGGELDGWFAELSSRFDPELGAVSVKVTEESEVEEVVVYDHHGRVLHRRVTKRGS